MAQLDLVIEVDKGLKGDSASIGPNGNWFIAGEDTGVKARAVDGKSAYQQWLDAGNVGTPDDFLNSLRGDVGNIVQTTGQFENVTMSQKSITDEISYLSVLGQSDTPYPSIPTRDHLWVPNKPVPAGRITQVKFSQPVVNQWASKVAVCNKVSNTLVIEELHDINLLVGQNAVSLDIEVTEGQYVGVISRSTALDTSFLYGMIKQGDVNLFYFASPIEAGSVSDGLTSTPFELDYSFTVLSSTIKEEQEKIKGLITDLSDLWDIKKRANAETGYVPILKPADVEGLISTGYVKNEIDNPIEGLEKLKAYNFTRLSGATLFPVMFTKTEQSGSFGFWFRKSDYERLRIQIMLSLSPAVFTYVEFLPIDIELNKKKSSSVTGLAIYTELTEVSGDYFFASVDYISSHGETVAKNLLPYDARNYPNITGNELNKDYLLICFDESSNPFNRNSKVSVKTLVDLKASSSVKLFLPTEIIAEKGKPLYLFKHALTNAFNYKNYNIQVVLDEDAVSAADYHRYWLYTPTSTGNKTAIVRLFDNDRVKLDEKQVQLKVVERTIQPTVMKTVLFIGDSLTFYNRITDEFVRVLTSTDAQSNALDTRSIYPVIKPAGRGWGNVQLIGTQKQNHLGWTGQTFHEGYSGWRWSNFLGSNSPFYYNGGLDFSTYLANNNFAQPDVIYIGLGWNDIYGLNSNDFDVSTIIANARLFLTALTTQLPTAKIRLWTQNVPGTHGGFGNHPYGSVESVDEQRAKIMMLTLAEAYQLLVDEFENVDVIWATAQIDSEYSLQESYANVNSRINVTEIRGVDYVHPSDAGFFQIADAIIADFINSI